jgi:hypothetical protein
MAGAAIHRDAAIPSAAGLARTAADQLVGAALAVYLACAAASFRIAIDDMLAASDRIREPPPSAVKML